MLLPLEVSGCATRSSPTCRTTGVFPPRRRKASNSCRVCFRSRLTCSYITPATSCDLRTHHAPASPGQACPHNQPSPLFAATPACPSSNGGPQAPAVPHAPGRYRHVDRQVTDALLRPRETGNSGSLCSLRKCIFYHHSGLSPPAGTLLRLRELGTGDDGADFKFRFRPV